MANEYLKPQTPLQDLNSENYFYPLTTIDQIILQDNSTRLNSLINKSDFIASRAIYYNGTKLLSSENIFLNDNSLGVNVTSIDSGYIFKVGGQSYLNGDTLLNGRLVAPHGKYISTPSSRYNQSALEIRENDLVGSAQTDIGYAPTIGFHWSGRIASTLAFGSDGIFYFRKQDGISRAIIDGFLPGTSHGDNTADFSSYSWHKIAEVNLINTWHDAWIDLLVTNGYGRYEETGILHARIRVDGDIHYQTAQLVWSYANSQIEVNRFKMVYYQETSSVRAEIWYSVPSQYQGLHFAILNQGDREDRMARSDKNNSWVLTPRLWGHGSASCPAGSGSITSYFGFILNTSNQARYLENRGGSTITINDVAWGHGHTPNGHTNRATIWHQRWYQSGLTYTPSGGSATTLTDCGDMVLWLSSSNTGNALQCNMALDGNIYLLGNIKAGGGRFGYDNYSYNFSASTGIFNSRLYCNEWIQFNGKTGLYFPNSGSGTHFYPANDCTYGGFQMQGTKGGYYGITSGPNNNFLTFMSQTQHQGLYNAANSQWVLYYDKTNKRACILGSSTESSYPIYLNASTRIIGACYVNSSLYVALPAAGSIYCGTYKDTAHGEHQIQINSGAGRLYMYAQAAATANRGLYGHNNAGTACSYLYIQQDNYVRAGTRLYGAVWNDYAEFRKGQMDNLKPGQVVTENGDGTMHLANQKLQKGCKILSDTYGFALGETEEYKLPIAVSGRVLVYCDTPNEELEPGDCLCANYTGNTIKMTEEEIIKYPDRIIATVSEFPNYEIWHAGDQTNKDGMKEEVKVNGRIWVYVR